MTDLQLYTELSAFPNELKKDVWDFIEAPKTKANGQKTVTQRQFGAAKGFFVMHKNFDSPLMDLF